MQSLFHTETRAIGELFSGANTFRMPAFQRPYCWDEARALQLFDDLYSVIERAGHSHISRQVAITSWARSLLPDPVPTCPQMSLMVSKDL